MNLEEAIQWVKDSDIFMAERYPKQTQEALIVLFEELAKERELRTSTHAELLIIHKLMMCVEEECEKDGSNDTMTVALVRNYLRYSKQNLAKYRSVVEAAKVWHLAKGIHDSSTAVTLLDHAVRQLKETTSG